MTTLERVQPYVERLLDDSEVHDHLERAAANLRGARARAKHAKGPRQAAADPKLRARAWRTLTEAVDAGVAIKQGPQRRRRRGRTAWVLLLAAAAAAGYLSYDDAARQRLLGAVGGDPS